MDFGMVYKGFSIFVAAFLAVFGERF